MFRASRYLEELELLQPEILRACRLAIEQAESDMDFVRADKEAFVACPNQSIDYAIMEKTDNAAMVPLDAGWSDIGSWSALWDVSDKSADGNVFRGDVLAVETENSLIYSEHRLVTAIGVQDLVIVETKDAVLVAHKDKVQSVKDVVAMIKKQGRTEYATHREVYRPWGLYDSCLLYTSRCV